MCISFVLILDSQNRHTEASLVRSKWKHEISSPPNFQNDLELQKTHEAIKSM